MRVVEAGAQLPDLKGRNRGAPAILALLRREKVPLVLEAHGSAALEIECVVTDSRKYGMMTFITSFPLKMRTIRQTHDKAGRRNECLNRQDQKKLSAMSTTPSVLQVLQLQRGDLVTPPPHVEIETGTRASHLDVCWGTTLPH